MDSLNPSGPDTSKNVVSEDEYRKDLIESAMELVLRRVRWRFMNSSVKDFDDWLLNVEIKEFKVE